MTSAPDPAATAPRSDAKLLAAARADPDAFGELYERYAEAVLGYFVRRDPSEPSVPPQVGWTPSRQPGTIAPWR